MRRLQYLVRLSVCLVLLVVVAIPLGAGAVGGEEEPDLNPTTGSTAGSPSGLDFPSADALPNLPSLFRDLGGSFGTLWDIVIAAAGIVFLVLLLIGGVQYLTSAGNDEQTKKSKTLLLDAIIGILLVVIAWPIGAYVLGLLGIADNVISGGKNIDPKSVLQSSDTAPTILEAGESTGAKLGSDATGDGLSSGAGRDVLGSGGSGAVGASGQDVIIQLQSGKPGVVLVVSDGTKILEVTTDSEGKATIRGKREGTQMTIRDKVTQQTLGNITANGVDDSNVHLINDQQTIDDLVLIRITATDQRSPSKQYQRFTYRLVDERGRSEDVTTSTESSGASAEVFLQPNTQYTVTPQDGTMGSNQQNTFITPAGPKGTENPATVWTIFVTPNAGFQEVEEPPDIPVIKE